MPQIVADTYEILREIGAGGGGVVHLARHLRLEKLVVVKADKRKLTARPETLRREVDALKNLSHTYIPQVYDYVVENGVVYTVMDYIEGESFDKLLESGAAFTQPQVIKWAHQLLEALIYLHGRPPHGILHSDIKPANIMLNPEGDVRLIDFNIALALGETGAVAIGRSLGYASPEHFGIDFSSGSGATTRTGKKTVLIDSPNIERSASTPPSSGSGTQDKTIMIDVRSDIYGLGATLYHILTGNRPAHHVREVVPLSDREYSRGLTEIINKAMDPNPDLRYQSAAEMLYAFRHLYENDARTLRLKRFRNISTAACICLLLVGSVTAFVGLKGLQEEQSIIAIQERMRAEEEKSRADMMALKKAIEQAKNYANESEKALARGDKQSAVRLALDALPGESDLYQISDVPEAVLALSNALGVYDLSDEYKPYRAISFDSEIIKCAISPNSVNAAVMSLGTVSVIDMETSEIVAELPSVQSALADMSFLDDDTIVYAGADGLTAYSVSEAAWLWKGSIVTTVAVSDDKRVLASVNRADEHASIYAAAGKPKGEISFGSRHLRVAKNDRLGDPRDNLFKLNKDGSLLAVSFSDGSLQIFDTMNSENDIELLEQSDYAHFEGGFFGQYFAFSATSSHESLFAVIDTAALAETISTSLPARIGVTVNESGIYMSYNGTHVRIDPLTAVQTPIDHDPSEVAANGYKLLSNIDSPVLRILKFEEHVDTEIFSYDPEYRHDESRLSDDGKTIMLFSIDGFRLYSKNGGLIAEADLPQPSSIYDQQYRREVGEAFLEVIYYDGTVRKYSAVDGSLISESRGESPDESLFGEYETDEIKITAPLHGTPAAFNRKTGERIRELEKDAYLTYVTQTGGYIITEYVSILDGSRYGLLLDGMTCETLAYLPGLCDVIGDRLIFDMLKGSLRETRVYSIAELMSLAKQ